MKQKYPDHFQSSIQDRTTDGYSPERGAGESTPGFAKVDFEICGIILSGALRALRVDVNQVREIKFMKLSKKSMAACLLLVMCLLAFPGPVSATIQPLNYWRMGENDPGAVASGSCTNSMDLLASNNLAFVPINGNQYPVYTAAVAATAAANTGSTLGLATTNGQYGTASLTTSAVNNFGLECWVKPATTNAVGAVLAYNGLRGNGWGLFLNNNQYEVLYGGYIFWGAGYAFAQPGVWTHLALVMDNGTATLYTNGVAATSSTLSPIPPSGAFTVAGDALYGEYFSGAIDEVRVFTFSTGTFVTNDLLYYQIAPPPPLTLSTYIVNEGASSGTDSVTVATLPGNNWSVSAKVGWLHPLVTSGSGTNSVAFEFDANPGVPRSGTLTINNQTLTVNQTQAAISFPLPYTGYYGCDFMETAATGGVYSVPISVTPNAGQWTCTASASWIHVLTPAGTGSTNIQFSVDPNTNASATVRWDYNGVAFDSVGGGASFNTKFLVYQQAPTPGAGQNTYWFTGHLIPYLPQYGPGAASAAFHSLQSNDVFYVSMTLVTGAPVVYFATYACGVNNITFSVPSRGLLYTKSFEDFEVDDTTYNPNELRWDAGAVDSTVDLTWWARDFSNTALASGNMPNPLDLTGFHSGSDFAQIVLYNPANSGATLWYGNLEPMPVLNITPQSRGTNLLWWVTSDASYTNLLQSATNLTAVAGWRTLTNQPVVSGLTNFVLMPATAGNQFFRLTAP